MRIKETAKRVITGKYNDERFWRYRHAICRPGSIGCLKKLFYAQYCQRMMRRYCADIAVGCDDNIVGPCENFAGPPDITVHGINGIVIAGGRGSARTSPSPIKSPSDGVAGSRLSSGTASTSAPARRSSAVFVLATTRGLAPIASFSRTFPTMRPSCSGSLALSSMRRPSNTIRADLITNAKTGAGLKIRGRKADDGRIALRLEG